MTRFAVVGTRALAFVLVVMTVGTSLLVAVPTARAPLTLASPILTPGRYTQTNIYIPGEDLIITLETTTVPPQPGDVYDVAIRGPSGYPACIEDLVIPPSGQLTITYTIPPTPLQPSPLPDAVYAVEVGDTAYCNSKPVRMTASSPFEVQEYEFRIEVDRPAYLGGDNVTVSWSATRLKDGSLAPDGVGQIWVYNQTWGYSFLQPNPTPFQFTKASGTTQARLPVGVDPDREGIVMGWFNSTTVGLRARQAWAFFLIERLSAIVDVAPGRFPNVYAPNGIVTTEVLTVATDTQSSPSILDPPAPGATVVIAVWDVTAGSGNEVLHPEYCATGLVTDAQGEQTYLFRLMSVPNNSIWEVRVNAFYGFLNFSARPDTFM